MAADSEIGNLIAEVMEKVGKDGVITIAGLLLTTEALITDIPKINSGGGGMPGGGMEF